MPLSISVAQAVAEASTELAAFDACLLQSGIGNVNLLYLSSVIPPGSIIRRGPAVLDCAEWGDRLYCVMAQSRTSSVGHEVWAGLGWVQANDSRGGLFAEAMGSSESEVRLQLTETLQDMIASRGGEWEPIELAVIGATCSGRPVCALVAATYQAEGWT
ncbi:MAG TPA: pyruvoyl-dependent arginine decarboxylase [Acidimicrobiales bacterium]|nr:pyruvoyl-dependent arginine decarboxylase [Acidimicrobiales bacterium]